MAFIKSTPLKILTLVLITIAIFLFWLKGLEIVYARVLLGGTNSVLGIIKSDTHIELEKADASYQFKVHTRIDGREASYPQVLGSLLQPTVIIIAWQIFLFFAIGKSAALRSLAVNFVIFYFAQIVLLVLLSAFYQSEVQKFFYLMLMDSFYIIALAIVIKDNLLYKVFK